MEITVQNTYATPYFKDFDSIVRCCTTTTLLRGRSQTKYVDKILHIIDHLPTLTFVTEFYDGYSGKSAYYWHLQLAPTYLILST